MDEQSEQNDHLNKIIILGAGTILVLGGIIFTLANVATPMQVEKVNDSAMEPTVAIVSPEADQGVVAAESETVIRYEGEEGRTVLDLLRERENVVTKDSSLGEYVDTINGVVSGTDGKYWLFYVNDAMAPVGAAEYITHDGDTVEWRLE